MLQHEFESLTGLKINESQYEVINGMYGCSNNQTKQDFCKMFMAMELMSHVDYVVNLKVDKMELSRNCRKAEDEVRRCKIVIDHWASAFAETQEKLDAITKIVKGGAE